MATIAERNISEVSDRLSHLPVSIEGEELKALFTDINAFVEGNETAPIQNGTIFITNYQLIITHDIDNSQEPTAIAIPLGTISRVKVKKKKDNIEIFCKHGRHLCLSFTSTHAKSECGVLLSRYAFPQSVHQLFAYIYHAFNDDSLDQDQVSYFDLRDDYERLRLDSNEQLRYCDNSSFEICNTYPPLLLVPSSLSEEEIKKVSNFRSRSRIPAVVWQHNDNGALLARCSQPCVGFKGNHSNTDEKFLHALRNQQQEIIYIMDSRPKANAVANMLRGGGYELSKYYKDFELEFNNIENIHVMRNSIQGVQKFCCNYLKNNNNDNINSISINDRSLPDELAETNWFTHSRLVLAAVARVVELMHHQACSVVVHCSDGWDRTAQTVATAELLLDPYYRTIEGFLRLIDKEWIQFGHQFALRYGHGEGTMDNYKESQRSPIFPQWLDILYQLIILYPTAFEFNESLLLTLMEELYACRFGNFLFDSHKQRQDHSVFSLTKSLWSYILSRKDFYTNENYSHDPSILILDLQTVSLKLWNGYFFDFIKNGPPRPPSPIPIIVNKKNDKDNNIPPPPPRRDKKQNHHHHHQHHQNHNSKKGEDKKEKEEEEEEGEKQQKKYSKLNDSNSKSKKNEKLDGDEDSGDNEEAYELLLHIKNNKETTNTSPQSLSPQSIDIRKQKRGSRRKKRKRAASPPKLNESTSDPDLLQRERGETKLEKKTSDDVPENANMRKSLSALPSPRRRKRASTTSSRRESRRNSKKNGGPPESPISYQNESGQLSPLAVSAIMAKEPAPLPTVGEDVET